MHNVSNENRFESVNLLLFLWKGRWLLVFVFVLAAIISIIAALSLREKFRSEAIIFPAKSSSVTLFESDNPKNNLYNFGEEEEAEQLVQILQSGLIRDRIIKKFHLIDRYEIDTTGSEWKYNLYGEYEENVNAHRTKYGSIRISVMDWHPDTAALMANEIVDLIDTVKNAMLKERVGTAYRVIEKEYEATRNNISSFVDTLTSLGKLGVVSPVERAELSAGFTRALINNRTEAISELRELIKVNNAYGSVYKEYIEKIENETRRLTELKSVYKQAKSNFEARLSYKFISERAFPSDKKAYPVRWLIVVMSCVSAFIFAVFLLIALDKLKEMRARLAYERS